MKLTKKANVKVSTDEASSNRASMLPNGRLKNTTNNMDQPPFWPHMTFCRIGEIIFSRSVVEEIEFLGFLPIVLYGFTT